MTITVVLDQHAGALRWSGARDPPRVVGVDLFPAMHELLTQAAAQDLELMVLVQEAGQAGLDEVQPLLAPARVGALGELDPAPRSGGAVFVAADRVLRRAAADRAYQPVVHPALALPAANGERYVFARVAGEREALSRLPGFLPYWFERGADGAWSLFGLLSPAAVAQALDDGLALERLALDAAVEDPLLVQVAGFEAPVGAALTGHDPIWSDGHRVMLALDAETSNDAIPAHGPHGHFLFGTPSPELMEPPPSPTAAGLGAHEAITGLAQTGLEPAAGGPELAPTPAPATATSFAADVGRYAGMSALGGAGPVQSRHSSHPDNARVVTALQAELAAIGYTPQTHSFSFGGRTLHNVIADLPGAGDIQLEPGLGDQLRGALLEHPTPQPSGAWLEAISVVVGERWAHDKALAALPPWTARKEVEQRLGLPGWYPWWHTADPLPGFGAGIVVVGCHLDSTAARDPGYVPASDPARGADDDASGIAATLAIARHLWSYRGRLKHTVRFCFFNAEESGLVGSRAYAAMLKAAGAPIRGVLCCDMIGHNSDVQRIFEVHAGYTDPTVRDSSVPLAELVASQAAALGALAPAQVYRGTIPLGGTDRAVYDGAINRSDHAAFHEQGYPAVVVTEDFFPNDPSEPGADANPNYHRNADAGIDAAYGADITRAVSLAVLELAQENLSGDPTVRVAFGATAPGAGWQTYTGAGGPGIFIDVDTSEGKFDGTPVYVTSLRGGSAHWATTGGSSIYNPTPTGFRVYVRFADGSPLTPATASASGWHVSWLGVG